MFCTLKSRKCFPGSNRFWWKERWSWCPRASCKYLIHVSQNVELRYILCIYRHCVRVPKHNQCNSNQTVMIILGRSWTKGTTRTKRIQRWSSKDINNSGIFFLYEKPNRLMHYCWIASSITQACQNCATWLFLFRVREENQGREAHLGPKDHQWVGYISCLP